MMGKPTIAFLRFMPQQSICSRRNVKQPKRPHSKREAHTLVFRLPRRRFWGFSPSRGNTLHWRGEICHEGVDRSLVGLVLRALPGGGSSMFFIFLSSFLSVTLSNDKICRGLWTPLRHERFCHRWIGKSFYLCIALNVISMPLGGATTEWWSHAVKFGIYTTQGRQNEPIQMEFGT